MDNIAETINAIVAELYELRVYSDALRDYTCGLDTRLRDLERALDGAGSAGTAEGGTTVGALIGVAATSQAG